MLKTLADVAKDSLTTGYVDISPIYDFATVEVH